MKNDSQSQFGTWDSPILGGFPFCFQRVTSIVVVSVAA